MQRAWPADPAAIGAARRFLGTSAGRIVVASHNDADGLAAAVIVLRALASRGIDAAAVPARRGEHPHQDAMRARLAALRPDALVVLDMGTRPGAILDGIPTLVIDHHDATGGTPAGAVIVNGFDREPVAPSSVLAFHVCRDVPGIASAAWLAAFGAVADLGSAAPFASLTGVEARGGAWARAVALINAARRAPDDDALTALGALKASHGPRDIVDGRAPGAQRLEQYRREVQVEVARCARSAPEMLGDAALIRVSSRAQVHPVLAMRWSRRLAPAVVVVANDGFIPGRVNFAMRCAADVNLLEWLRALPFVPPDGAEYANGHPRATGGSLPLLDFGRFAEALRARAAVTPRRPPASVPRGSASRRRRA